MQPDPEPARAAAATPQRESALRGIRRAIVLGELRPGDRLPEVPLAARLGVSRPTLREAMNQLVQDGLLRHEPYRGVSVTRLEPSSLRDLATTREALDRIAVRAVLDDPTGTRRDAVRAAWEEFDRLVLDPDPLVQHEAHVAFHHRLWEASQNSMLVRLWPVTESLTTIALAQDQASRADPRRAHAVHRDLVAAILSGDLAATDRELHRHTIDSAEELLGSGR